MNTIKKKKQCKCGETDLEQFGKNRSTKDGLAHWCKQCACASTRDYNKKNKKKINAYAVAYKAKYSEKVKERNALACAKYREKNLDRVKAYQAEWRANNTEKRRALDERWRNRPEVKAHRNEYIRRKMQFHRYGPLGEVIAKLNLALKQIKEK